MKLFSIIIATFNSGKYLSHCLESIINQSFKDYEIIIIDGKSTDNTIDVIRHYGNYISYWISENDSGIYDAWNKGLSAANGDWVIFIGSDDEFYPNALNDYAIYLNELNQKNVEYISSKMNLVNSEKKVIKTIGAPWNWKKCRLQNVIAHPGSLHRKTLFDKYGLYNTEYKICGDFEFLLRPGIKLNSAFFNKITVKMQQGGVSTLSNKVFKEHYLAAVSTGNLNVATATAFYYYQICKSYIKSLIRIIGIDI